MWTHWRRRSFSINVGLLALLIALIAVFTTLAGTNFLSLGTASAFGYEMPELGVLSLAMMVAMISGGLNLSIVSTANICALTIGSLLTILPAHQTGALWILAIAASIGAGFVVATAIGLVTGYIIAFVGVSPILATLGMMTLLKGLAIGVTRGNIVSGFPEPIVFLGNGTFFGVPMPLLVFLACAIPVAILLTRSPFGLSMAMIGSNERAAHFSGVDTRRVLVKIYVLSSLLACVAGVILMARFNSANASYGGSYLLVTVLACVLGGVDPYGGFGRMTGVVLALAILQVIASAFNVLGLNAFLAIAVWGIVLIMSSAVASRRRR